MKDSKLHMNNFRSHFFIKMICICVVLFSVSSCQMSKYAKGVLEDNQNLLEKHKTFIQTLEFTGNVKDKLIETKGKYRYRLLIEMDTTFTNKIEFNPYYSINGSQINIVVSEELYKGSTVSSSIFKKKGSSNLQLDGKEISLISSEKYVWLNK